MSCDVAAKARKIVAHYSAELHKNGDDALEAMNDLIALFARQDAEARVGSSPVAEPTCKTCEQKRRRNHAP